MYWTSTCVCVQVCGCVCAHVKGEGEQLLCATVPREKNLMKVWTGLAKLIITTIGQTYPAMIISFRLLKAK